MKLVNSHHIKADIVRKPNSGIALDVKKYIHKVFPGGLMDEWCYNQSMSCQLP